MEFDAIDPFVRRIAEFKIMKSSTPPVWKGSYDHRLMFIADGELLVDLDKRKIHCRRNTLVFWTPGQWYRCISEGQETVRTISIFFDFDHLRENDNISVSPPVKTDFHREWVGSPGGVEGFLSAFSLPDFGEGGIRMTEMLMDYAHRRLSFQKRADANLVILLTDLYRRMAMEGGGRTTDNAAAGRVIDYIHRHIKEPLNNQQLAQVFNYHPNHLNRIIRRATGISLHRYIQSVRIRHALGLLESTGMTVTEIAHEMGYSDSSHFIRVFRRETGHTPKEFSGSDPVR